MHNWTARFGIVSSLWLVRGFSELINPHSIFFAGSLIFVLGEMDENGYYTAIYENCRGKIPANFVQEIEIQDQELINRFASQVYTVLCTQFAVPLHNYVLVVENSVEHGI